MSRIPHYQIVSIGSAVRDLVFRTDQAELVKNPRKDPTKLRLMGFEYGAKVRSDDVEFRLGGGASNTAMGLKKLGLRNAVLVCLGDDEVGDMMTTRFTKARIDTTLVQRTKQRGTGFSFLVVESATNEHVAFVYYGANMELRIKPTILKKFTTDWFYISSLSMPKWSEEVTRLTRAAAKTKSNIAWNPGATQLTSPVSVLKPLFARTDILILNKDEATELALRTRIEKSNKYNVPDLAKHLHSTLGSRVVLVTNGKHGSHVYDGVQLYFAKPTPDKPVDTTGAGDCFGSSFVAGMIKYKHDINKALQVAVINSTSLVAHTGAQQGLLTWQEIQTKLRKTK